MPTTNAVLVPTAALAAIFALALGLRLVGLDYGLPFWIVNDELPLVGGAMRMLELRNPIPSLAPGPMSVLYYPPGLPLFYLPFFLATLAVEWIAAGFPSQEAFVRQILSDPSGPWRVARVLTAVSGAATAVVVAKLAAEIFRDGRAGVIAGLLFACSFHHNLLGHFARVWTPTVFLFWVCMLGAWRIYATGRRRDYVLAALGAGLGFAVNYLGVLAVLAAGFAHLVRHRRLVVDRNILLLAVIVAAFIVVFIALYWQNFMRLVGYSPLLADIAQVAGRGQILPLERMLQHYGGVLWKTDPSVAVLGAVGLAWCAYRAPAALVGGLLACGAYLAVIFASSADDDRYILPATPLLMIAGAGFAAAVWRRNAVAGAAIAVLAVAMPLAASAQFARLLLTPDTRIAARAWVLANAAPDEGIANAMRAVGFEQTRESLTLQSGFEEDAMTALQRRKLAGQDVRTGGGGREVNAVTVVRQRETDDPSLGARFYGELYAAGYRWYLADDLVDDPLRRPLDPIVRARGERVARFAPAEDDRQGPLLNLSDQLERTQFLDIFRIERLGPVVEVWRMR